ncbi:putative polysaccharide biosynthesis protein [Lacticaseibacillus nasuensis]|uniref:putative polysaccharide biosynthesis protein n=1 Tax=Lacticaseibacillus nasuensis TaxID=944671 RepID=UPI002246641B|nr:polysaccharide biosynthesis protein [Lacticaseibacillus nasuensis]MCX2456432.1 polysaccharide biosynthesis protein [Lacticaseibacillus nasuensis]
MQNRQMKRLMAGAWALSVATLIAKVLSAVYRVPFQNMVGDTGFYVYQQVYPLYGIGMTFALSGFPVFISKVVAEAAAPAEQAQVAHRLMVLLSWLAGATFIALELGAGWIAAWMGDGDLADLIQTVAFMFLVMPLLATIRGYYQGTYDMTKTAVSQVVEQVVRVAVILLAAWLAGRLGWSVYQMGAIAMSGAFFGGAAALVVIVPAYWRVVATQRFTWPGWAAYRQLAGRLVREGGLIAMFAAMVVLLQLIDSFTVTKGLVAAGVDPAVAKVLKGVYDRGQPLVQLGLVVATALSTSLLPGLATAFVQRQQSAFVGTAQRLVRFTQVMAVAATAGLIAIMPAVNWLLFGDTAGTLTLQVYVVAILLVALINADAAILQSSNQFAKAGWALAIGLVVKLVATPPLVRLTGTMGAAAATVLALGVIGLLTHLQLPAPITARRGDHFLAKLALCTGVMVLVVALTLAWWPLTSRLAALLQSGVGVLVGLVSFIGAASAVRLLSIREVLALPFGRRLLKALRRHRS